MFSISYWWSKPKCSIQCDPNKTYIENSRVRFLKLLRDGCLSSYNIDSIVYNKNTFHQVLTDPENHLEKSWKARLLIESTPLGNIVMYYDIFKQGFAYYSDQPIVPYDILNSVAMKYVARFSCLDFFMDENILGMAVGRSCSLLKAIFMGEEKDDNPKNSPGSDLEVDLKTAPFAKLKNYATSGGAKKPSVARTPVYFRTNYPWFWKLWFRLQYYLVLPVYKGAIWGWKWIYRGMFGRTWRVVEDIESVSEENKVLSEKEREKLRNKFIYLGRFRNLCLLQKAQKKGVFVGGAPTKYDTMFGVVGGKALSYKDFKVGKPMVS